MAYYYLDYGSGVGEDLGGPIARARLNAISLMRIENMCEKERMNGKTVRTAWLTSDEDGGIYYGMIVLYDRKAYWTTDMKTMREISKTGVVPTSAKRIPMGKITR